MNDVNITVLSGGLQRRNAASDGVSGLVVSGIEVNPSGVQFDTAYKLESLSDADVLGISENYDDAATVFVYEHIKEFFRVNPNGTLWLYVIDQSGAVLDEMVEVTDSPASKLLDAAGGEIRLLGVFWNNTDPLGSPTTFDMSLVVPNAQALCDARFAAHEPLDIFIGGNNFDTDDTIVDLATLTSKNVSVVVGGHSNIASQEYSPLGTYMGIVSSLRVNQSPAWVREGNVAGGNLQIPTITSVVYNSVPDAIKSEMHTKGYTFLRTYTGRTGVYFNASNTCVAATSDFRYMENNRTINKAARLVREALLPYLNSPIDVNAEGKLSEDVVKTIESSVRKLIDEQMLRNSEVSDFDVYINPDQNILSTSELAVEVSLRPTGKAEQINVTLGFTNPFNS